MKSPMFVIFLGLISWMGSLSPAQPLTTRTGFGWWHAQEPIMLETEDQAERAQVEADLGGFPHGVVVIPLVLEEALVAQMEWVPEQELWLTITYYDHPRGEPIFEEAAERVWWLGDLAVLVLGGSGETLPREIIERGVAWIRLHDADQPISQQPIELYPRKRRLRLSPERNQIARSLHKMLPGIHASYLAQVAHFLAGNLTNLDVQGTSYSISGFGEVINSAGEWTGGPIGGQVNTFETIVADSGMTSASSSSDTLTVQGGGTVNTTVTGNTLTITATEGDGDATNELQNLFATIHADSGSTTADQIVDVLLVEGGGLVSTSLNGDTLTVSGSVADDSLDFSQLRDALTLDATTTIDMDNNSADLNIDQDTVMIDSSANRVGIGTASPLAKLHVDQGSLLQTPGNLVTAGDSFDPNFNISPLDVVVQGDYMYATDLVNESIWVLVAAANGRLKIVSREFLGGTSPSFLFVSGNWLYMVDNRSGTFVTLDLKNPAIPNAVSSTTISQLPQALHVQGRYAYVAAGSGMDVLDIGNPYKPTLLTSVNLGGSPTDIYVQGNRAYVTGYFDAGTKSLKIIELNPPSSTGFQIRGSLLVGNDSDRIHVVGQYAYVLDGQAGQLQVVDVADDLLPRVVANFSVGANPTDVFVAGRYAYVTTLAAEDLKVIDLANPAAPVQRGALSGFISPDRVFVAGRFAYIADANAELLSRVDISGVDVTSLNAGSLAAGRIQVASDVVAEGDVRVAGGVHVGKTGLFSSGDVSVAKSLTLSGRSVIPAVNLDDQVQLFSSFVSSSAELQVRDEAGNVTTLSPHNFSLIGTPSEPLAWSYYSRRGNHEINVDMLKAMRLIERLSGEKLVYISERGQAREASIDADKDSSLAAMVARLNRLEAENRRLNAENEKLKAGDSSQ